MTDPPAPDTAACQSALAVLGQAGFRTLQTLGYHLQPNDFYTPLNDCAFLDANRDLWTSLPPVTEIDWHRERQFAVAAEVGRFVEELRDVPERSDTVGAYCWDNGFWNNSDALVQYGLVRSC